MEKMNQNNGLGLMTSVLLIWYQLNIKYHQLCLRGCMCPTLREEIINKVEQHSFKFNELRRENLPS